MHLNVHSIPRDAIGVLLFVTIEFICLNRSDALHVNKVLPCDFQDSINITGGTNETNGSIKFNNIIFSKDEYAKIDYFLISESVRVLTPSYLRGCPCKVRSCIRLCCSLGKIWDRNSSKKIGEVFPCRNDEAAKRLRSEILDENKEIKVVKLNEIFSYVIPVMPRNYYVMKKFQIKQVKIIHSKLKAINS